MERAREVAAFWAWLPAFRAVAETEHLPSASAALHVTPSALSRTIRLLEDEVGAPLFDRVGRRLVLNAAGQALLNGTRRAMREVHEASLYVRGATLLGAVHIGCPGPFAPLYVLPALESLNETHPELAPHLHAATGLAAQAALERGDLDVAITDDAVHAPELEQRPVRPLEHDVFVAPLPEGAKAPPVSEVGFVAPPLDERQRNRDAWPDARPRRVALRVDRMATAIHAVRQGPWAVVLPVDVGLAAGLQRLGVRDLPRTELTLMHRPTVGRPGRTEAVAEAIATHLSGPSWR